MRGGKAGCTWLSCSICSHAKWWAGRCTSSRVEVTLKDGHTVSHFTRHAPGTKENPLTTEEVNAKARSLMAPVLGAGPTEEVIRRVNALEAVKNVRELRPFLTGRKSSRKAKGPKTR